MNPSAFLVCEEYVFRFQCLTLPDRKMDFIVVFRSFSSCGP